MTGESTVSAIIRVGGSCYGGMYGWNEQRDERAGVGQQGSDQSQRSLAGSIRPGSVSDDR